jgi:Tol biopolymer transport system component
MSHSNSRAIFSGRLGAMMKRRVALLTVAAITTGVSMALGGSAQALTNPGTNGKIAFTNPDPVTGVSRCFTINPDATGAQQIGPGNVNCPSDPANVSWSPDSSKLLVSVDPQGNARPATANPDGSDFTLLDHYPNLQQPLSCGFWSPDGARFLCKSAEDGNPTDDGLYTLRSSDGGGLKRVTTTPDGSEDSGLGYSPDGSEILFSRNDSSTDLGNLFVVNPNGTGLLQLNPQGLQLHAADCCNAAADWSPDGSHVAFAAFWKGNVGRARRTALFVVNADGTGLRRITPFGLGARNGATWSPDGRLIAFNLRFLDSPGSQVWVVHPDGAGLMELTLPSTGYASYEPVWSPDSTRLLFERVNTNGESLWIANTDGGGLTKLADIPGDTNYAWGSAPVS